MTEPEREDEGNLEALNHSAWEAESRGRALAAVRLAGEVHRRALAERQLIPAIRALHLLADSGWNTLDPDRAREAAVELIALLESSERARKVQPDLDEAQYEQAAAWYSSCAYDNLAKATALAHGYNSEGVHDAIGEGIEICRRTGKLECINCFREYASDVHRAADDLDLALHHARHVATHGDSRADFDRRWSGADTEAELLLLGGQLEAAEAAARRAFELAATFHSPYLSRLQTLDNLRSIRLLRGLDQLPDELDAAARAEEWPPAGEYPLFELRRDQVEAIRDCLRGDFDAAIARLTRWDARLHRRHCLAPWFEVRLRLIAVQRLAGNGSQIEALARPLVEKAREARDWMTLRRLARALDPSVPAAPFPAAGPFTDGPFAPPRTAVAPAPATTESEGPDTDADAAPEVPPTLLDAPIRDLYARLAGLNESESGADPRVRGAVLDAVLALGAEPVAHPFDAARLIHLAHALADPARAEELWTWAEAVAAPFPRDALVLNLLADFGDTLRDAPDSTLAERLPVERLETLFRHSLDLDPNQPGNFARAAGYYLKAEKIGEAERCLARASRLDRGNGWVALRLAGIYTRSERSRDALAILDMCLREGNAQPEVAWEAATTAHNLGRYEAMATYLDRFEALQPGRPWVHYYRALGALETGQPEAALAAVEEERRRFSGSPLHLDILRACAAAALGRTDEFRTLLEGVLATRLAGVDSLSYTGFVRSFERLWVAASRALPDSDSDPLRRALEDRLLATGLAPNAMFVAPRKANPKREGIGFYHCHVLQPLDATWRDLPGCLPGEGDWARYRVTWGVLASDAEEAARLVQEWQSRCGPLPAVVENVELQDEGYTDHPGVVWQGFRAGETA